MENARDVAKQTMALVLAGGRGSRLKMLTDNRAKPAVYFGGKYRIIDFALSNCVNSGIMRIGVVTQYKSHSLLRHLQSGWSFLRNQFNEFIDLLPAQQRVDEEHWYQGTADAVYQNIDIIKDHRPKYVLILAGDHIYKMDYSALIMDHIRMGSPVTVACIPVPREQASALGVMEVNDDNLITKFVEKPKDPPAMPGNPNMSLASMGIYVFDADFLYQVLDRDAATKGSHRDFGMDIIPAMVRDHLAHAHDFSKSCIRNRGNKSIVYWRDVGTIDAYWEANMDIASVQPQLDVYDSNWPIWTNQAQQPPAKFVQDINGTSSIVRNSTCSAGCIISGSSINQSVLFTSVRLHSNCFISESVILPFCIIHRGCRLTKVILDRGVEVPRGLIIGENAELDAKRFYRSEGGVTLVTRKMMEDLRKTEPQIFQDFDNYRAPYIPSY
ncbi:MAG: glucose-1-phosphate adenylyltransferase [Aeromonadales bacterium]|nr:glucose-1-phosphate adenylyltransferase [Aeromonadales bacterium]MDY2891458.1 glucose-1-phosphate adenylyltransferase [Succinivibrio sp.]